MSGTNVAAPAPASGWADALLDRVIGPLVDWVVGGLVAALVILVGSGVLARYVLNYSLAWSDEMAGLGFVWLTLLGSVAATRRRTHMVIGFLPKLFGPTGQRAIGLYAMVATLVFCGFMVGEGIVLTAATMGTSPRSYECPWGCRTSLFRWQACSCSPMRSGRPGRSGKRRGAGQPAALRTRRTSP